MIGFKHYNASPSVATSRKRSWRKEVKIMIVIATLTIAWYESIHFLSPLQYETKINMVSWLSFVFRLENKCTYDTTFKKHNRLRFLPFKGSQNYWYGLCSCTTFCRSFFQTVIRHWTTLDIHHPLINLYWNYTVHALLIEQSW